jgi:hypothetical protein
MTPVEEQSLVQWILDLDRRGFPPRIIDVRRMADVLLTARGQDPPFFHSQRAKCEDPVSINAWFRLVHDTYVAYGIPDEDVYNFDKTGLMMSVAATSKVVTNSDCVGRATVVQPGNRDWVTTIECINASGWSLLPFVILSGILHQASWY